MSRGSANDARQGRLIAVVIAVSVLSWIGLHGLGSALDWPARYAFLIDFAAMAALLWSLINALIIWRKRRDEER